MHSYGGSEPDAVALRACEDLGTCTGKNEKQFLAAPPFTPNFLFFLRSLARSLPPSRSLSLPSLSLLSHTLSLPL